MRASMRFAWPAACRHARGRAHAHRGARAGSAERAAQATKAVHPALSFARNALPILLWIPQRAALHLRRAVQWYAPHLGPALPACSCTRRDAMVARALSIVSHTVHLLHAHCLPKHWTPGICLNPQSTSPVTRLLSSATRSRPVARPVSRMITSSPIYGARGGTTGDRPGLACASGSVRGTQATSVEGRHGVKVATWKEGRKEGQGRIKGILTRVQNKFVTERPKPKIPNETCGPCKLQARSDTSREHCYFRWLCSPALRL